MKKHTKAWDHKRHHTGLIPTCVYSQNHGLLKNHSILQAQRTRNSPWAETHAKASIPPTARSLIHGLHFPQACSDLSTHICVYPVKGDAAGTQKQPQCQGEYVTDPTGDSRVLRHLQMEAISATQGIKGGIQEEDHLLLLSEQALQLLSWHSSREPIPSSQVRISNPLTSKVSSLSRFPGWSHTASSGWV